jgi:hypothetical protein
MILVDYPLLGTMKWKLKWVPPPFESLISSFGAQHCQPNQIYTIYAAAQSPTQTSFLKKKEREMGGMEKVFLFEFSGYLCENPFLRVILTFELFD